VFTIVALSGILSFTTGAARADITLEQSTAVEGVGIMSVGNMSGTSKTIIAGDRARTDSDLQLKSRFVRMLAGSAMGPTAQIVRLDQGKIYQLDLKRKQYTEMTFDELHAQLQNAMNQANQAGENGKPAPSPIDESQCEWLEPKADIKKTGEKGTFAGFEAERVTITASQPCKDKKTGAICEIALSLDEWVAPKFNGGDEALKFHRAYAQKMGLDAASAQDVSARAQTLFGRYKGAWSQIASKMKDTKGYPVKMSFGLAIGGEQCQSAQSQQQQQTTENQSTPGGLAGQIGGKIAGALFHRKKDDSQPAQAQQSSPPAAPPGTVPLMTITSELLSVSTASASPDSFDVPADFKKTQPKTP
jgi:hypothetical protein